MASIRQNPDGSAGWISDAEGIEILRLGGPKNPVAGGTSSSSASATQATHTHRAKNVIKIPVFNGTAGITGACGLWINNTNETYLVGPVLVDIPTGQSVTFSISVGTSALSAGVPALGNNLLDTANYGTTTAAILSSIDDHGTNGKSRQRLQPGEAIVVTSTNAILTATVNLYVEAIKS